MAKKLIIKVVKEQGQITNEELFEELAKRGFFVQRVGQYTKEGDVDYILVSTHPPKNT